MEDTGASGHKKENQSWRNGPPPAGQGKGVVRAEAPPSGLLRFLWLAAATVLPWPYPTTFLHLSLLLQLTHPTSDALSLPGFILRHSFDQFP